MRRAAKKQAKTVVQPVVREPPREKFVPEWLKDRPCHAQGSPLHLISAARMLAEGRFRLPRFQRPWRWSDADILALMDSLLAGYHTGELLLWDRYDLPASAERFGEIDVAAPEGRGTIVVDGQQRLGAIATAALGERFRLHLLDGRFGAGADGPWWCPVRTIVTGTHRVFDWIRQHATDHELDEDRVLDATAAAMDALAYSNLYTVSFDHGWTLARVIESYRRLNTTGVKMSAEDLEAGLRRAMG